MKGFKGFDKDMKCQGFQYEIGKAFEHKGEVELCKKGFHFCENPLDVFSYYFPNDSKYAEINAEKIDKQTDSDSKRVCKRIFITVELSLKAMIDAAIKITFDRADWSKKENHVTGNSGAASATGYSGAASATGNSGAASATGDSGAASATGYRGAASATGKEGCAVSLGIEGKAKGAIGCWLTLAEWEEKYNECHRIDVQTKKVDGKKIKADTFYILKKGKFEEAK